MASELANLGVALRAYLRESTVLASADYLGSNREIYIGYPKDKLDRMTVPPYRNMIVIMPDRGGPGRNDLAQMIERVDFFCYGESEIKCAKIFRALDYYFNPVGARKKTSFTRANCQVNTVTREGGPLSLVDNDLADWPYTLGTYIINYNGQVKT